MMQSGVHPLPGWIEQGDGGGWILICFPYHLRIEFKRSEVLPFVGSVQGALCTVRGARAWGSLEEAKDGMIAWAMDYTMELYQQLGEFLQQPKG